MNGSGGAGYVIGLDIGGAHLKLALVARDGRCVAARELPCRLWEGLDRLEKAVATGLGDLPGGAALAVTMTGELVDHFADRATGVRAILGLLAERYPARPAAIFEANGGFVGSAAAAAEPARVASMNWLASAMLVARRVSDALFVDCGSTTTDLVAIRAGRVAARAISDADRLAVGELVYVGHIRTPLMALAAQAPIGGRWSGVMAEYFATLADAWRVLGRLDEAADQHPPADNGPKTVEASARRLARMVGADAAERPLAEWQDLARFFIEAAQRRIEDGLAQVLAAQPLAASVPVVGTGVGRPLSEALARRSGRPYLAAAELVPAEGVSTATIDATFPAVAIASLLASHLAASNA